MVYDLMRDMVGEAPQGYEVLKYVIGCMILVICMKYVFMLFSLIFKLLNK